MMAPPRSRWRSAVPDAMPARVTGTDPVSECDAGVPAKPDAGADEHVPERDLPVGAPVDPQHQHRDEPEQHEDVAGEQVKREPLASISFAERGATSTMQKTAGRIAAPDSNVE